MKKVCFLLALLLLLSGCAQTDPGTTETPGTGELEETIPESIDYHQTVLDMMATLPKPAPYDGERKIHYDPDRKVFISLMNQDCDFYPDDVDSAYAAFHIITLEHYDVSQIKASFAMETAYTVDVVDRSGEYLVEHMPYRCYAVATGADLYEEEILKMYNSCALALKEPYDEKLNELRDKYYAAKKKPEEMADYLLVKKHVEGYRELNDAYHERRRNLQEAFEAVPREELPRFYLYTVCVNFTELGIYEETVETAVITVGEEDYSVSFGQWRFHKERPQEMIVGIAPPGLVGAGSPSVGGYTYADGYGSVSYDFTVDEAITVLGMRQMESAVAPFSVKGAQVILYEIKDGEKIQTMDYFWDGHQPLYFEAGEIVKIQFLIQDDRLFEDFLYTSAVFFLDYEVRNRTYSLVTHGRLFSDECYGNFLWDVYFRYFEEGDMGEWHYYNPVTNWYDDMPAEWLE